MPKTKTRQPNYWIIDKDIIHEGAYAGRMGPRDCPTDAVVLTQRFRLLDDDGEVYYEGRMLPFEAHDRDSTGFEPLDHFGEPNDGCTELQYLVNGTWETL